MGRGHRKVREGGDAFLQFSCDSDCEICQEQARISGTGVNWGPDVWPTGSTARIPAVVSLSTEGDPF